MLLSQTRRHFIKTASLGLAAAALPIGCSKRPSRTFQIGHTGITWGYSPTDAEQAIKDVDALGYHYFESMGHVLDYWAQRGGIETLLEGSDLKFLSAYCPTNLTEPDKLKEEIAKMLRWGELIKKAGGHVAVVGPNEVDRSSYNFKEHKSNIVTALNEIGKALTDIGITSALHQHTGSCVESPEETYGVFESVNSEYAKMCPDVGELLAGGNDPVKVIKDFLPIIAHAHMKDHNAGSYNDGYCSVGSGKVDMPACLDILETSENPDLHVMAELNPNSDKTLPKPPRELAQSSRDYLKSLGYRFRTE